ncbi:hypothetical protein BUZ73_11195 [Staphylococcus saprophyticus]|jgi:hypothetical protein|nr:hypothetical protein BUZ73_11195 [Staphylococcus saprophyticus]PTK12236.1 hypothetical protein BUZ75_06560 [Staphylococcus saprophyticus]RIM58861.1 DUF3107 family protein [Staphylococcus arlettae]RIO75862.1 DUF3107 family protein [Staphylococcus gallinarum]
MGEEMEIKWGKRIKIGIKNSNKEYTFHSIDFTDENWDSFLVDIGKITDHEINFIYINAKDNQTYIKEESIAYVEITNRYGMKKEE